MSQRRILVCGAWDIGDPYPRPRSLIEALERLRFTASSMRVEMPYAGRRKQRIAMRPHAWPLLLARLAAARRAFVADVADAVRRLRPDAVFVPYPGHLVAPWVRSVYDGPIVLDLFLSVHDTLVADRRRFAPTSWTAAALRRLDRRACEAADLVLLDTPEHAAHVAELVGLPSSRFDWVPVGDPQAPDRCPPYRERREGEPLEVLFFGTGVPLHGLPHLLEAVRRTPGTRLTLIGGSPAERRLARRIDRVRVRAPFVGRAHLARALERCHLVAGIFGDSGKAGRVVPLKVVHALAAGRPVLTADTPAVRRFLAAGAECLTCRAADPESIGAALREARQTSLLASIARRARAAYERGFSASAIAARLAAALHRAGVAAAEPAPPVPSAAAEATAAVR